MNPIAGRAGSIAGAHDLFLRNGYNLTLPDNESKHIFPFFARGEKIRKAGVMDLNERLLTKGISVPSFTIYRIYFFRNQGRIISLTIQILIQKGGLVITIRDSIEIKTTGDRIFDFLINLDKHYLEWHPDHVKWVYESGRAEKGALVYYEEYLHGELHKIRSKIVHIEENKKIEFKNSFPFSLICPKGSFIIEQKGESSTFIATLSFRFGRMLLRFAKDRYESLKKHMDEEGKNIKRLLEKVG